MLETKLLLNNYDLEKVYKEDGTFKSWNKSYSSHKNQSFKLTLSTFSAHSDEKLPDFTRSVIIVAIDFVDKLCFGESQASKYLQKFWFGFETEEDRLFPILVESIKSSAGEGKHEDVATLKQIIANKYLRVHTLWKVLIEPISANLLDQKHYSDLVSYFSALNELRNVANPALSIGEMRKYAKTPLSQAFASLVFCNSEANFPMLWKFVRKLENSPLGYEMYQMHPKYSHKMHQHRQREALRRQIYVRVSEDLASQNPSEPHYLKQNKVLNHNTLDRQTWKHFVYFEVSGFFYRLGESSATRLMPTTLCNQSTLTPCK